MQIIKIILVLAAAALMYPAVWLISLAEKIPGNSRLAIGSGWEGRSCVVSRGDRVIKISEDGASVGC